MVTGIVKEVAIPNNVLFGRFISYEMKKLKIGQKLVLKFFANEDNRRRAKFYVNNKLRGIYNNKYGSYKVSIDIILTQGEINVERVFDNS